jgi:hypothetical protein
MSKTNVTVEVREDGAGFVGIIRSAKTGRELFASAVKETANRAQLAALGVVVDRKWNEVTA